MCSILPNRSSASTPGVRRTSELRITTAAEAAARDRAAIEAGTPSFELMLQAGTATASLILREYADRLHDGVAIFAGVGNNGGDAYVVAAQLARAGVAVRLHAIGSPRTDDARRAAALVPERVVELVLAPMTVDASTSPMARATARAGVVVDGLLGTGHAGALRASVRNACDVMAGLRADGARIIALDIPTGLDATSGDIADGSVPADCTVCYGTIKRGVLLQRGHAGRVVLVDIGLGAHADRVGSSERGSGHDEAHDDGAWRWLGASDLVARVPRIDWNAHKGRRGRVLVAGGEMGMAGAVVFAARAALLAGAGVVHTLVDTQSVSAVQALCEAALAHRWPALDGPSPVSGAVYQATPVGTMREDIAVDAVAIGPGLGRSRRSGQLLQHVLARHREQPMVLDADALWHAADAAQTLGIDSATLLSHWLRDVPQAVCTPHPGEFARLTGAPLPDAWDERVTLLQDFVHRSGATVLLKGTPTLVASPDTSVPTVVPHGTALLATGGSGDCLTGLIATLLAQGMSAHDAAVVGASVHGRAAEMATARGGVVRGTTLDDFLATIPAVWRTLAIPPVTAPYVIAELPALASR